MATWSTRSKRTHLPYHGHETWTFTGSGDEREENPAQDEYDVREAGRVCTNYGWGVLLWLKGVLHKILLSADSPDFCNIADILGFIVLVWSKWVLYLTYTAHSEARISRMQSALRYCVDGHCAVDTEYILYWDTTEEFYLGFCLVTLLGAPSVFKNPVRLLVVRLCTAVFLSAMLRVIQTHECILDNREVISCYKEPSNICLDFWEHIPLAVYDFFWGWFSRPKMTRA